MWNQQPSGVTALIELRDCLVRLLQLNARLKVARAKRQMKADLDAVKPVE